MVHWIQCISYAAPYTRGIIYCSLIFSKGNKPHPAIVQKLQQRSAEKGLINITEQFGVTQVLAVLSLAVLSDSVVKCV